MSSATWLVFPPFFASGFVTICAPDLCFPDSVTLNPPWPSADILSGSLFVHSGGFAGGMHRSMDEAQTMLAFGHGSCLASRFSFPHGPRPRLRVTLLTLDAFQSQSE